MAAEAPSRPGGMTAWAFINSTFFIWLMTTVFGGMGVWAFQQWRDTVTLERQRGALAERLDLEISGRLAQYAAGMQKHEEKGEFKRSATPAFLIRSLGVLAGRPNDQADPPIREIYAEFRDRTLLGLYAERRALLESMTPEDWKKKPAMPIAGAERPATEPRTPLTPEERYQSRRDGYRKSISHLVAPDLVVGSGKYAEFRQRFTDAFLGYAHYDLPYADCFNC